MKFNLTNKWLLFVVCLFVIGSISSQNNLNIQIGGDTNSYSGATYQMVAPSKQDFYLNIEAHNISTSESFLLHVTCIELNTLNGWADGFCWGPSDDPLSGQCYSSGQVDSSFWTSPHSMLIDTNKYGALKLDLYPDTNFFGQSHYRYLFGVMENGSLNQIDSIDILIDYFANTSDFNNSANAISVFPNPATNYFSIVNDYNESYKITICDVMGNQISSNTIIDNNKNIDVSSYKNGLYFIRAILSDGTLINKRLTIKH
tara:strand:- start:604 stop:1377 length:774 start_codon:yes stop_codon:yes gene_type:complete